MGQVGQSMRLMNAITNSSAYLFEHDEPESEVEMQILGSSLQETRDSGELSWNWKPAIA